MADIRTLCEVFVKKPFKRTFCSLSKGGSYESEKEIIFKTT